MFIGYGADDPPVQYLLEALNKKNGQLAGVYAFQDGTENEAIAKWSHKGIEAIAYDGNDSHHTLWETLAAWAERAKAPESWFQEVIDLAKQGPEALQPFQRGQVAHVVSTLEGTRKFSDGDNVPPAEWLCVFDPWRRYALPGKIWDGPYVDPFELYCLDSDSVPQKIDPEDHSEKRETPENAWTAFAINPRDRQTLQELNFPAFRGYYAVNPARLPARLTQFAIWISKISDQPAAVWWAGKQTGLHPDIQHQIRREIIHDSKPITPLIRQAWHYLFEAWLKDTGYNKLLLDRHHLKTIIKKDGWNGQILRQYVTLSQPYLKVESNSWRKQKPPDWHENIRLADMLSLEVEYPKFENDIHIPEEWLAQVIRELRINLGHAQQLEKEIYGQNPFAIGSILPDDDPKYETHTQTIGLLGHNQFFQTFRALGKTGYSNSLSGVYRLATNDQSIFDRLRIWIAGMPELVSEQTFLSIMQELHDDIFWDSYSQKDLLQVLFRRWNQLPERIG